MIGDEGPYMEMDGPRVWVPRTVPYLAARRVAQAANQNDDRLVYLGKTEADLLGFSRDCLCDETCEMANRCRTCGVGESWCGCDVPVLEDWDVCRVPAWSFELVER